MAVTQIGAAASSLAQSRATFACVLFDDCSEVLRRHRRRWGKESWGSSQASPPGSLRGIRGDSGRGEPGAFRRISENKRSLFHRPPQL